MTKDNNAKKVKLVKKFQKQMTKKLKRLYIKKLNVIALQNFRKSQKLKGTSSCEF